MGGFLYLRGCLFGRETIDFEIFVDGVYADMLVYSIQFDSVRSE